MKRMKIMEVIKKLATATYAVATMALLAMPVLSSCEKSETPTNGGEGNIITLSATSELPDTKTSLGESNVVNWTTGDKITTFWGNITTAAEFTLATGEGTTSATFTGTPTQTTDECYAIYPHNSTTTINSSKTISFTLPATQTYKAGGFAEGANPMVAYKTAAGALQFKNLCAVLKLQLKVASGTQTIKKITISSATKKLSGAATVAMNYTGEDKPAIVMATDATANNYVELTLGDGVELNTTAKAFYIVVPPVAAGAYSVTIETASGAMLKTPPSSTTTNSLVRAKITTMPSLDYVESSNFIENGVDHGAGITIGSTTWAPVNCGYAPYVSASDKGYPYGKLYQWGRKYGQGYDSNDATYPSGANLVAGPVALSVGQDATNIDKFYKNLNSPYDWVSSPSGTLWNSAWTSANGDTNPVKVTANDPCPAGWRVPTSAELTNLRGGNTPPNPLVEHNSQKGAWFNGTSSPGTSGVFLPAAGYRSNAGSAGNRGDRGYYWSSTPPSASASNLYFYSGYADMSNNNRALGLSVRCVRE
jgi:uncharacterized protein (TIGR02145 family)